MGLPRGYEGQVSPMLHSAGAGVSHSAERSAREDYLTGLCKHDFKQIANSKARGARHKLRFCRTYQKLGDGLGMLAMGKTEFMFKLQVPGGASGLGRLGVRQPSQVLDPS